MPESTRDLAAIVEKINKIHAGVDEQPTSAARRATWRLMGAVLAEHWPAIRANLMFGPPSTEEEIAAAQCQVDLEAALLREDYANRRTAELEAALRELVTEAEELQESWRQSDKLHALALGENEQVSEVDASDGPALAKARALLARSVAAKEERRG